MVEGRYEGLNLTLHEEGFELYHQERRQHSDAGVVEAVLGQAQRSQRLRNSDGGQGG